MQVRDATETDLAGIVAIYNHIATTSAAIWRDTPITVAERLVWFRQQAADGFPVLVAADDEEILGYASFGSFRPFPGYELTVEHSIHVAEGQRSRGVGQALLDELIARARAAGKAVMIAGSDGDNHGSIRFHQRNGFREVGRLPGVGRNFGQPSTLVLLQLDLDPEHPA